ncbi:Uncharacterised protein [Segatella oris]|uniref:Uncharacterized protein n=1 Tax=Segatella oris TaxID=28135 RepID=A0A3S4T1T0_9BACT|nr:Uncharacterised protein [Segatella oris]
MNLLRILLIIDTKKSISDRHFAKSFNCNSNYGYN